jgi:hypothetical protein
LRRFRNHPINEKIDNKLIYPSNCNAVSDILKRDIFKNEINSEKSFLKKGCSNSFLELEQNQFDLSNVDKNNLNQATEIYSSNF